MKIYLKDRTITFTGNKPECPAITDLVVEFRSAGELQSAWEDFKRFEKFLNFIIIDPEYSKQKSAGSFKSFVTFFTFLQAAGGIVKNENGEFLFIHRFGLWDLPKGKIDKKDIPGNGCSISDSQTARAAAIREVKEETGIQTVVIMRELPSTWHIYTTGERWFLKKTRWFDMEADSGQTLKPQTSEGIFLVKWTPPNAIHCILSHTYASIRELLVEVIF
ncbi:MAG: NUDIX domain-containing protein [Bacteroidales bacterium]|nr:NUDIX domain-containing protein [Bacteroidales bacterium]